MRNNPGYSYKEPPYNYKTEKKVENKEFLTLKEYRKNHTQDQLKGLKAEVATNDKGLIGRLRLRKKVTEGKNDVVLYRLSSGKEVKILDNKIYTKTIDGVKRNFVKVKYKNSIGYLPEEYLKVENDTAKVETTPPAISKKEEVTTPKIDNIPKGNEISKEPKPVDKVKPVKEVKPVKSKPIKDVEPVKEVEPIKENKKVDIGTVLDYKKKKSYKSVTGIGNKFDEGETIITKDNEKFSEFNHEIEERIKKPKVKLITQFTRIWIDGARKAAGEQWNLGGLNNDKKEIQQGIESVFSKLETLLKTANLTDNDINNLISAIFKEMKRVENNNEDIIDNIEDIEKLFNGVNENNYEARLAKILKLSAGGLRDGNTEKAKDISREIIIKKYFKNLILKLDKITDIHEITYDKFKKLKLTNNTEVTITPEEFSEIRNEIQKVYQNVKASNENIKNSEIIRAKVKKENPNLTESEITTLVNKLNTVAATIQAKQSFLSKYTDLIKDKINSSNDPVLKTFQDLDGFWQKAADWTGENGTMIALSLIPLGGGAALSAILAKIGTRAVNYLSKAKYLSKLSKIPGGHLATFAKGVAFYEGMNMTNNILHLDKWGIKEIATTNHDVTELVKTALFFNVMKVANTMFPVGQKIISKQAFKNFSTQVAGITGVDILGELHRNGYDLKETLTWEQVGNSIITGLLYATMDHGLQHIPNLKNPFKRKAKIPKGQNVTVYEGNPNAKQIEKNQPIDVDIVETPKQIEYKPNKKQNNPNFVLGEEGVMVTSGKPHTVAEPPKQIEYKRNTKVENTNNINKERLNPQERGLLIGINKIKGLQKTGDYISFNDGIKILKTNKVGGYKVLSPEGKTIIETTGSNKAKSISQVEKAIIDFRKKN